METCLVKIDGSGYWCQVTSILFSGKDGPHGLTIIENIGKRMMLEPELKIRYDNPEEIMHIVANDLKSHLFNIKLATGFLNGNRKELLAQNHEKLNQTFT